MFFFETAENLIYYGKNEDYEQKNSAAGKAIAPQLLVFISFLSDL
jgi:hypothetical protein